MSGRLKTTFHYSSQLQTWLQTWLSTRFTARFSTSSCGFATCFRHSFDFFLSKTWSRTCCINLDMSRLMQQVRWFVRVLDKWNIEKNPFRASQRTCWSWIFVTCFIIRAYIDVIKWKNAMKKLDFTLKNVINCVHNEPALWDTECTDIHPEITVRINSYHWLSFLEAQCYTHHICVCLWYTVSRPRLPRGDLVWWGVCDNRVYTL